MKKKPIIKVESGIPVPDKNTASSALEEDLRKEIRINLASLEIGQSMSITCPDEDQESFISSARNLVYGYRKTQKNAKNHVNFITKVTDEEGIRKLRIWRTA